METMLMVVVVVIVAVAGGIAAAWYTSRGDRDEVSSIKGYHNAVRTLEDVTHRADHPAVRAIRTEEVQISERTRAVALRQAGGEDSPMAAILGRGAGSRTTGSRSAGSARHQVTAVGGDHHPDSEDGPHAPSLVFDEVGPVGSRGDDTSGVLEGRPSPSRRRDLSIMDRPRLWRSTGAVIAACGLAAVVVVSEVVSTQSGRGAHTSASKVAPPPAHSPSADAGKVPGGSGHSGTTGHHAQATTAMTVLYPTSSPSSFAATYAAPSSAYAVTLTATGSCWVMAKSAASGAVLWTGTLHAGQVVPVLTTGTMTLELGVAGDVAVKLIHDPVMLPATYRSPFTETFTQSG